MWSVRNPQSITTADWRCKTSRSLCACAIVLAMAGCGGVSGGADECDDAAACAPPRVETDETRTDPDIAKPS